MSGAIAARNEGAMIESLTGKTLRWTFADGPVAGKTYEHTFNADGSVAYRSVDGNVPGTPTREKLFATDRINDHVFVISYITVSGNTLTVLINFLDHSMIHLA